MADMVCSAVEAPDATLCRNCGEPFQKRTSRQVHCSKQCNGAFNARSKVAVPCERCETPFFPMRPGGANIRKGTRSGVYCSPVCQHAARVVERVKPALPTRPCAVCRNAFSHPSKNVKVCSHECAHARAKQRAKEINASRKLSKPRQCKECLHQFVPQYGDKRRVFCSDACMHRSLSRVSKAIRRRRMRGVVERVDPIAVFERDGWKCHLCGVKTDKRARGRPLMRAPELDHIVALALGGDHTYRNTACACRRCNMAKGAADRGQPSLLAWLA
jgi:hypothetical protein